MRDLPGGSGPLADNDIVTGGPIDDPATADRANPRWEDPTSPVPDAQSLTNPDGSTNVLPPRTTPQLPGSLPDPQGAATGTDQDQAAQELPGDAEVGTDNIREGRGDSQPNPALAEGGDHG